MRFFVGQTGLACRETKPSGVFQYLPYLIYVDGIGSHHMFLKQINDLFKSSIASLKKCLKQMLSVHTKNHVYKAFKNCTHLAVGAVGCSRGCSEYCTQICMDHKYRDHL
jgi:hypothetical protein